MEVSLTLHEVRDVELGNSAKVLLRACLLGADDASESETRVVKPRRKHIHLGPEHNNRLRLSATPLPDLPVSCRVELWVLVEDSFDESEDGEELYGALEMDVRQLVGDHLSLQLEGPEDTAELELSLQIKEAAPPAPAPAAAAPAPVEADLEPEDLDDEDWDTPSSGAVGDGVTYLEEIQPFEMAPPTPPTQEESRQGSRQSSRQSSPSARQGCVEEEEEEPRQGSRQGSRQSSPSARQGRVEEEEEEDEEDRFDDRDRDWDRSPEGGQGARGDRAEQEDRALEEGEEEEEEEEEEDWEPVDWVVDILLGGPEDDAWDYGVATQFSSSRSMIRVDYGESNYDITLDPQHMRLIECNDKASAPLFHDLIARSSWRCDWEVMWFDFDSDLVHRGTAVEVIELQNSVMVRREDAPQEDVKVPVDLNLKLVSCRDADDDSKAGRRSLNVFENLLAAGMVLSADQLLDGELPPVGSPAAAGSTAMTPGAGSSSAMSRGGGGVMQTIDSLAEEVRHLADERHRTLMLVRRVFYEGDVLEGGQELLAMADEENEHPLDVSSRSVELLRTLEDQIRSSPGPKMADVDESMVDLRSPAPGSPPPTSLVALGSPAAAEAEGEAEAEAQPSPKAARPQTPVQGREEQEAEVPEAKQEEEPSQEPVNLEVFIGTFNTGNAGLDRESLGAWLPAGGGNYDVLAVGLQETRIKKKKQKKVEGAAPADGPLLDVVLEYIGDDFELVVQHEALQLLVLVLVRRKHAAAVTLPRVSEVAISSELAGEVSDPSKAPTKGAVIAACCVYGTQVAFVNCHLEGHEGANFLDLRNRSCAEIIEAARLGDSPADSALEFLYRFHHVFWLGNLNYRVNFNGADGTGQLSRETHWEEVYNRVQEQDWANIVRYDELQGQMELGNCLCGFEEPELAYPPTFKVERTEESLYSERSIPSYTDRVLYHSLPGRASALVPREATSCPGVLGSDHKPVMAGFSLAAFPLPAVLPAADKACPTLELSVVSDRDVGTELELQLFSDPPGLFGGETLALPVVPRDEEVGAHPLVVHLHSMHQFAMAHVLGSLVSGPEFVGQCVVPLDGLRMNKPTEASVAVLRGGKLQLDLVVRMVLRPAGAHAPQPSAGCKCSIQ